MKKLLLSSLFLLTIFISNAQDVMKFGLYVDPAVSWMKIITGSTKSNGAKFGWAYGLVVDQYFAEKYAFSSGIEVVQIGGELRYDGESFQYAGEQFLSQYVEVDYSLQYIQIPITLKFKTNEFGFLTYFAQVGFTPSVKTQGLATISPSSSLDQTLEKVSVSSHLINNFNLALTLSGGFEYSLGGTTALFIQGIFKNGFINIANNSAIRLNYLALRIGVMF